MLKPTAGSHHRLPDLSNGANTPREPCSSQNGSKKGSSRLLQGHTNLHISCFRNGNIFRTELLYPLRHRNWGLCANNGTLLRAFCAAL